jgi:hypothetical protein
MEGLDWIGLGALYPFGSRMEMNISINSASHSYQVHKMEVKSNRCDRHVSLCIAFFFGLKGATPKLELISNYHHHMFKHSKTRRTQFSNLSKSTHLVLKMT